MSDDDIDIVNLSENDLNILINDIIPAYKENIGNSLKNTIYNLKEEAENYLSKIKHAEEILSILKVKYSIIHYRNIILDEEKILSDPDISPESKARTLNSIKHYKECLKKIYK